MTEKQFVRAVLDRCSSPLATTHLAAWQLRNTKTSYTLGDVESAVASIKSRSDLKRCGPKMLAKEKQPRGFARMRTLLQRQSQSSMRGGL